MSLVEQLHAERKARLARLGRPGYVPRRPEEENTIHVLEKKLATAQALNAELEDLVARQRDIIRSFADSAKSPLLSDVIAVISKHYQLPKQTIVGAGKSTTYVFPRHVGYYIGRRLGYSLHQIGRAFDKDHTTVLYGAEKIAARAQNDLEFAKLLNDLEGKMIDFACTRVQESQRLFA